MDQREIDLILSYLQKRPDSRMLEWGSGGSTVLFPKFVSWYTSIEHNLDWYAEVRNKLVEEDIRNIEHILVDIPKGVPTKREEFWDKHHHLITQLAGLDDNNLPSLKGWWDLKTRYIWHEYIDWRFNTICPFDFVLIDGRARVNCAQKALEYLSDDGIVFIHDFFNRVDVNDYKAVFQGYEIDGKVDTTPQTIVALRRK
jgi:hypothetical protein